MMSEKRALEIIWEMFDVMYQCSNPSISWYELIDNDKGIPHSYSDHYLDGDECEGIFDEYRRRLDTFWRRKVSWFFLSYSPTCNPSDVKER